MNTLREKNRLKIEELKPHVQWAAMLLEKECWDNGIEVEFLEVFRSQERQNKLWEIGRRGKDESSVTWTRASKHTLRLAADIRVINEKETTRIYKRIECIASKYKITHPLAIHPYFDLRHFEFGNVSSKSINPSIDRAKMIHIRRMKRLLKRLSKYAPKVATRLLGRLKRNYGDSFIS